MRSIRLFVAALLFWSISMNVPAQQPTATEAVEAMKRIEFLAGRWSGGGWIMLGPGKKQNFSGTETVASKLDGTVLVIEGVHRAEIEPGAPEKVIHNALAVVSFDPATKKFRFQSYLADGRNTSADAEAPEKDTFIWSMKDARGGTSRFTIKLDEKGNWVEIGEYSMDGKTWRQFFEMKMQRVK